MKVQPERVPLTRERVLDAAIALADRDGLDALTMRRVGAALGVQAMSLYNYVANKQDLLDGVAGALLAAMHIPTVGEVSWEGGLREVCRSYRQLAHSHPGLFALVVARPLASPEAMPPLEATLALLLRAGLDELAALDVFQACASFVGGFALGEITRRDETSVTDRDESPPAALLDGRYPITSRVFAQATPDRDRAFETGLDLLIAGLPVVFPSWNQSGAQGRLAPGGDPRHGS